MRVPRGSFAAALIQALALSLCSTHTAPAQEWPSFRGAFARGVGTRCCGCFDQVAEHEIADADRAAQPAARVRIDEKVVHRQPEPAHVPVDFVRVDDVE